MDMAAAAAVAMMGDRMDITVDVHAPKIILPERYRLYTYIHTYIHTCIHVYIYTYIHTCIHSTYPFDTKTPFNANTLFLFIPSTSIYPRPRTKIILPESSTEDRGYIVLDLGRAQLNGFINSVTGLTLSLHVTSLCAGLPPSLKDIYVYGEKGVYLIRPVDVKAEFTAIAVGSRFQSEAFKKSQLIDEEENTMGGVVEGSAVVGGAGGSAGGSGGSGGSAGGGSGGSTFATGTAKAPGMSLARPDLHVHLQVGSELQITLDSPKILRLIDLLRTFITFVVSDKAD